MKKILTVVLRVTLVVALIFSVTACKPKPTAVVSSSSNSISEDTSPFTLEFYTHDLPTIVEAFELLIEKYNMQYPWLTVNYNQVPGTEYGTKVPILFATEQPVDLINIQERQIGGLISKISEAPDYVVEDIKTFAPASYDLGLVNGKIYGYLNPVSTFAMVNKTMFEEAGLDYPTTYDEVIAINEALSKTVIVDGAEVRKVGANLWFGSGSPTFTTAYWNNVYSALGGVLLSTFDGPVNINNPTAIEATELFKKLSNRDAGYLFDFAAGNVGWIYGANWQINWLKLNGVEGLDFECITVPKGVSGEPVAQGYYQLLVVPNWTPERNQKEAWKFTSWAHNNENNYILETIGGIGDWRLDTMERLSAEDPMTKVVYDAAPYATSPLIHPKWAEIERIISDWVEKYIYDEITVEEALTNCQAELDALFN